MIAAAKIEPYEERHREGALDVLAEAYSSSPVTAALLGDATGSFTRTRELFELRLAGMLGAKLVAICGEDVAGFVHWTPHPPYSEAIPQGVLDRLPEGVASRLVIFQSAWRSHDWPHPHSHLGPIAVAPRFQGRGVARQLMRRYCAAPDVRGSTCFLETDRARNVSLFSEFGFEVSLETEILDARTWFMHRNASVAARP